MNSAKHRGMLLPVGGKADHTIEAYFETRAHLANYESTFQCDPTCSRPGCRNLDLLVPVSLMDLLGAARYRGESVSTVYRANYSLGLLSSNKGAWLTVVSLRLRKPCPFLEKQWCSIYPVRPLPCILFPENLVVAGTLEEYASQEKFKDYQCLHRSLEISPARAEVLARLREIWRRESVISSFHLFHYTPFYLDLSNLREELLKVAKDLEQGDSHASEKPLSVLPSRALERVFLERIARCEPFNEVERKISDLDGVGEQERFFELVTSDVFLRELSERGDDRIFFRYIKGRLKAKRQSSIPWEYRHFY